MKQKLFFAMVAAAAMASCTNDEVLQVNQGEAIGFRTAIKRAAEITTGNLTEFHVTSFNVNKINAPYFENLKFVKNESFFVSEDKYYYPGDGSALTFYAYAPSMKASGEDAAPGLTGTLKTDSDNKNVILEDFSPAADIAQQVDFITANATGTKDDATAGVALNFGHRLSQIRFEGHDGDNKARYTVLVKGVRIVNAVSKGSFDFSDASWTLSENPADKAVYTKVFDEPISLESGTSMSFSDKDEVEDNAMLIPQTLVAWNPADDKENTNGGAYISILIQVKSESGALVYPFDGYTGNEYDNNYAWAAVPTSTEWTVGKRYTYSLDFTNGCGYVDPLEPAHKGELILDGEVKYTVEVEGWEDSTNKSEVDMGTGEENSNAGDLDEGDFEDPWS